MCVIGFIIVPVCLTLWIFYKYGEDIYNEEG